MKKLRAFLAAGAIMFGLVALPVLPVADVAAQAPPAPVASPKGDAQSGVNAVGGAGQNNFGDLLKNVINILLFLIGAISVIMIIIGGIRYTTSGGDASSVTGAKNTVLYSVVGLIVAIMAYAIVNFILGAF